MSASRMTTLIDMDSSGIPLLLRLIRSNIGVTYCPFTPMGGLRRLRLTRSAKTLILAAINNGSLLEGHLKTEICRNDIIMVSYISMLGNQIDDRDVAYVYDLVKRKCRGETRVVHVGLHKPGFMMKIVETIGTANDRMRVYFVPYPLLMRGKIPVAGPDIEEEVKDVMLALAGRARIFPGLSYLEAEAVSLSMLLTGAASYAALVEMAQILAKSHGVSLTARARALLGGMEGARWLGTVGNRVLELLCEVEAQELEKTLLAGAIRRIYGDAPKLLKDLVRPEKKVRSILIIGSKPAFIDRLDARYVVRHMTSRDFLEKGARQTADLVILSTKSRRVYEAVKSSHLARSIIFDLNTYSIGGGERGNV